jgi:hypothetical protein
MDWDITKAEEYLTKKRKETNLPLTLTHFVGFCAGRALSHEKQLNGRISFGNVSLSTIASTIRRTTWRSPSSWPAKTDVYLLLHYL